MRFTLYNPSSGGLRAPLRLVGAALVTTSLTALHISPALADITNDADASGTYNSSTVTSPTDNAAVPVAPAAPAMTVAKSVATPSDTNGDGVIGAGDTLTYSYLVTNTGNVTITGATPVDVGPTFNNVAGVGTLSAFSPAPVTLAPAATQTFTATYVLQAVDVYRAAGITLSDPINDAVENSATATGSPARGTLPPVTVSSVETTLPATTGLTISKTWAFATPTGDVNGNGQADVGDQIVYTYEVTNSGNVTVTNVVINDVHEGAALPSGSAANETLISSGPVGTSSDAANNGSWDSLTPASTVRFTYTHTVNQTEFNNG